MKSDQEPTDRVAQALRQALKTSGKTIEEVAKDLDVHRNTVHRWLKGESQPRGLMRGPLARAFGINPAEIWTNMEAPGSDLEVVKTWKHLQDVPTETWVDLVQDTTAKEITVLAGSGTRLTEGVPRLDEIIRAHDVFGAKIRICFGDPESEHTAYRDTEEGLDGTFASRIKRSILEWKQILEGLENAELRVYNTPYYHSIYRFGKKMLIAHHGYKQFGTRSATIMLHRVDQLGIFDNYTENFDRIWADARHITGDVSD